MPRVSGWALACPDYSMRAGQGLSSRKARPQRRGFSWRGEIGKHVRLRIGWPERALGVRFPPPRHTLRIDWTLPNRTRTVLGR